MRNHPKKNEKKDFIPIDIVCKPTLDETKEIQRNFCPDISLTFRARADRICKGELKNFSVKARLCPFCSNYFVKPEKKMKKHMSVCSGKAGFKFSFENGKIINYQDHYNNLGDLPFSVYYDFETTTGNAVVFDAKMYIVSYCMIVAFHPELNLPRISIFRCYDQTESEITSLSHFENIEHDFFASSKRYFNMISLKQLEPAAQSVYFKENKTALAEMFNIELKFTVDCVKNWFNKSMKVLELEHDQKRQFIKENNNPNLNCSICDFPLKPHVKNGWLDHVIKSEYLFLKNIFTDDEMLSMELDAFEKYEEKKNKC